MFKLFCILKAISSKNISTLGCQIMSQEGDVRNCCWCSASLDTLRTEEHDGIQDLRSMLSFILANVVLHAWRKFPYLRHSAEAVWTVWKCADVCVFRLVREFLGEKEVELSLIFDAVEETDMGNYTCNVENHIGRGSGSAVLQKKGEALRSTHGCCAVFLIFISWTRLNSDSLTHITADINQELILKTALHWAQNGSQTS